MTSFEYLPRGRPGRSVGFGEAARALWQNPQTLAEHPFWSYDPQKVFLGHVGNSPVGIADNRHLLTIAGSRAGKGTSSILPNLLLYPGSVLVLDPKGENATASVARRGNGDGVSAGGLEQNVYVLDPFGVADVDDAYRAGFNPIAALDPNSDDFIDECDAIADALVVSEQGKENDHWNAAARIVLRGFIAWVAVAPGIQNRDLMEVRRLLFLALGIDGAGDFDFQLAKMTAGGPNGPEAKLGFGVPYEAASSLIGMSDRELSGILSTVRKNIAFLASPPMARIFDGGTRSPDLLRWKHGGQSIYLCLPAARLHQHFRLFRLFINCLLGAIEKDRAVPSTPALMILDEMHVLGKMEALEKAAGLVAGFGVRIWSIWQDLTQLKSIYGERWETFLGNASVFQTFGLNDLSSLKYVSDRLGQSSVMQISQGEIGTDQAAGGFSGQSTSIQTSPLLTPEEIAYFFSRQSGNQLIIYPGADPIFLQRLPYFEPFFDEVRPNERK